MHAIVTQTEIPVAVKFAFSQGQVITTNSLLPVPHLRDKLLPK